MSSHPLHYALILAIFTIAPAHAQQAKDSESLVSKYKKLINETAEKSPLIQQIFQNSNKCAPDFKKGEVQAAEAKADQQLREQNNQLQKDKRALETAEPSIKAAVDSSLKGLRADVSKVDICAGEVSSVKQLFEKAKKQSKSSAEQEIEAIAKKLNRGVAALKKQAVAQYQKNISDRPTDVSGLRTASNLPIMFGRTQASNDACKKVLGALSGADSQIKSYIEALNDLDKKIDDWKEEKKAETFAQIDAQMGKAEGMMLAGKSCEQGKDEQKLGATNEKPSNKSATAENKAPAFSEAKPKLTTEPEAPVKAAKSESPATMSEPSGKSTVNDSAEKFLTETSTEKAALPQATVPPTPGSSAASEKPTTSYAPEHDSAYGKVEQKAPAIMESKPAPLSRSISMAEGNHEPSYSDAPDIQYDYGKSAMEIPHNEHEHQKPLVDGASEIPYNDAPDVPYDYGKTKETTAAGKHFVDSGNQEVPEIQYDYGKAKDPASEAAIETPEIEYDYGKAKDPTAEAAVEKPYEEPTPKITADDDTSLRPKDLKKYYQSNDIFQKRDLDFNSKKDTTMIQRALNQVQGGSRNPSSQITADGVFGSRTTARLDAVMQDPVQKAAFLKALRVQMSR